MRSLFIIGYIAVALFGFVALAIDVYQHRCIEPGFGGLPMNVRCKEKP